jgi:hypothetical protein
VFYVVQKWDLQMEKTFTVAGTSRHCGVVKYRFANDLDGRTRHLQRVGHTQVQLFELPHAMIKDSAVAWLNSQGISLASESSTVERSVASSTVRKQPVSKPVSKPVVVSSEDDDFVEPRDERIQVAMCRLARVHPDLSASRLLEMVQQSIQEFGTPEPPF